MKKIFYTLAVLSFTCDASFAKDAAIDELSESVRELTGKIETLEKSNAELQKDIALLKESFVKKAEEESAQKEVEAVANKTPEEIVKTACDMIEENDMDGARKLINAFVSKNPGNIYCGMMLFYSGNSYFVEKDYKNAALEYMKSFKANPRSSKSAESLYKLALCFKNMSETEKCKSTLSKIVSDYPGEFAKKAASELKKIK